VYRLGASSSYYLIYHAPFDNSSARKGYYICSWFMRMRFRCDMVLVWSNRNLKLALNFLQNLFAQLPKWCSNSDACGLSAVVHITGHFTRISLLKCASYIILPSSSSETNTIFINCNFFQLLDSCWRRISDHMVMARNHRHDYSTSLLTSHIINT
jgi:hypothetical protein